jgi:uncharacterized membrane protein
MALTSAPALTPSRTRRPPYWLIPTGLILLSLVPVIAGSLRITELASAPETTPENARFVGMPIPVIIHIVSATIYCLIGAFQFHPGLRRRHPSWHRASGRVLIPMGIAAALSGLWMTTFYDLPATDGGWLPLVRWVFGVGMIASIALALIAVRRRDFSSHRAWMIRGYAIGIAAGTQAFTTMPWFLIVGELDETARTITMTAGWVLNLAVAEWIIRRQPTSRQSNS